MVLKILSSKIREDKAIQDFQIRNEEIKTLSFQERYDYLCRKLHENYKNK